jgi:hypothetical protein
MNTTIPLDLLWKAWPEGRLDMRGVATINYGTCFGNGLWVETDSMASGPTLAVLPFEWRFSENSQAGPDDTQACLEAGYFLPLVDPADHATWACLLADLAEAVGRDLDPQGGLVFTRQGVLGRKKGDWLLLDWNGTEVAVLEATTITDPATALATARAKQREGDRIGGAPTSP